MELSRIFKKPLTRQVPHYLLIIMKKIWKIEGISHKITNQIQSFQTNRSQRVAVRGALFTELPVSSGVPQQSLLGPTLFLNYINDLPKTVLCNVRLYYADDTLLYSEVSSKQEKQLFQLNINALHDWSTKWKMLFNTNECQIIAFSSNKTQADPIFMLGGNSLRYVQEAGYLWIEIQITLGLISMSSRKSRMHRRYLDALSSLCMKLRKMANFLHALVSADQYQSMDSGDTLLDPSGKKSTNDIELLQNRAIRFVKNIKSHSTMSDARSQLQSQQSCRESRRLSLLMGVLSDDTKHQTLTSAYKEGKNSNNRICKSSKKRKIDLYLCIKPSLL